MRFLKIEINKHAKISALQNQSENIISGGVMDSPEMRNPKIAAVM